MRAGGRSGGATSCRISVRGRRRQKGGEMKPAAIRIVRIWLAFVAVATLAAGLAVASRRARASPTELPMLGQMPSFEMTDQRGQRVSDETLRGQVLVVDFFFASCTTSCPMLTGKMLTMQKAFAWREHLLERPLPLQLVSITLDPDNDSPEVLRAYAERTGADDDRWSFLSGRSEDLDRVVVRGFKSSFQRTDPTAGIGAIMHGEWFVLVDASGALRGYYAARDPERMEALVTDAVRLASAPAPATPTPADGPKVHHAVGVIKSFGPARAFVNIAHEDIPGYMMAMTMSFEPGSPGQLDGLREGDRVEFDFIETPDARRSLTRIAKRP